ncbi:iron-hydroxamate ABC transporter substrate-binding protein [Hazenella sp. IB182357]|uniref:Iron-hydroxamate ABC transporter substrate-binding protein n=1 Tax=Polycladospora coralii TaxID=2771432 RepID=A0A926N9K2_9BACL|nr:iron-hydroxamate ABC transporter substrate-binding protein [Polycladospora coralii]MBD1371015.1 iron-hydroxamate ABC transporter substrate-binding protein [Polycladospora coralii]MBS7529955.1 iron-hydroxamate ABC transporter substrate-binding protein [Polycladospora coralii]
MKKFSKFYYLSSLIVVFSLLLVACSNNAETITESTDKNEAQKSETQTVTYLEKEYTLPKPSDKIVTASLEAMEDAAILGVKPIGATTIGGKLPEYLASDLQGAKSIGEKMQPNYEEILSLKPDVILGTTKFQPDVKQKLEKIGPMIPVSHVSINWEDNLKLMGQLTGKTDQADQVIKEYKDKAAEIQQSIQESIGDKKVVVARIRRGNIYLYHSDVYLNPVLYNDLGIKIPKEIKAVKAQDMISLEKFAELNPDYLFLQFAEHENSKSPKALEELQNNPIWKNIQAVKDNQVYINSVDPMAQGGTAWSKSKFIDAAVKAMSTK